MTDNLHNLTKLKLDFLGQKRNEFLIELFKKGMIMELELVDIEVDEVTFNILKTYEKLQLLTVDVHNWDYQTLDTSFPANLKPLQLCGFIISLNILISIINSSKHLENFDLYNCKSPENEFSTFNDAKNIAQMVKTALDLGSNGNQQLNLTVPRSHMSAYFFPKEKSLWMLLANIWTNASTNVQFRRRITKTNSSDHRCQSIIMSTPTKTKFSIIRNYNCCDLKSTKGAACNSNTNQNNSQTNLQKTLEIQSVSDDTLTRLAIEEICRETTKGAIRAEKVGPSGWLPCPLRKTNKRFLRNTIKSVISHNNIRTKKPKTEKELDEIIKGGQLRKPKFGERKHCFRQPNDKASEMKVED